MFKKDFQNDRNATWLAENHVGLRPTGQDPGGDTQYTTPMPLGVVLGGEKLLGKLTAGTLKPNKLHLFKVICWVVVSNIFYFHPYHEEGFQFD